MTKNLFQRDAGILLHPTSLPGRFGVGDFGPGASHWLKLLADARQSLWQVLPLGHAGYGDSPYQALSAFAANPVFLSPERLHEDGLITGEELESFALPGDRAVDYTAVYAHKKRLSLLTTERFSRLDAEHELKRAFATFVSDNDHWLEDYALFLALKEKFDLRPWHEWPVELRDRSPQALEEARRDLAQTLLRFRLEQFLLDRQWQRLRREAESFGIRMVGDLPIFVAHDSADVWCHKELFRLEEDGSPSVVAGVPPDYFSEDGQLWGNPLYAWDRHQADGFSWWHRRLRHLLQWVDVVRIDHFRGFVACWEIPGGATTAQGGRWIDSPGKAFFESLQSEWDQPLPFIAEDLGVITPEVVELRDHFGLPGIRVMQFAFGDDPMKSTFIPESFEPNCAAYTGTHDNDTVTGWFNSKAGNGSVRSADQIQAEREAAMAYFGTDGSHIHRDFIDRLYRSEAGAVVVPIQDLLGLGTDARMNRPGEASGSWRWRLKSFDDIELAMPYLWNLTEETLRGTARNAVATAAF